MLNPYNFLSLCSFTCIVLLFFFDITIIFSFNLFFDILEFINVVWGTSLSFSDVGHFMVLLIFYSIFTSAKPWLSRNMILNFITLIFLILQSSNNISISFLSLFVKHWPFFLGLLLLWNLFVLLIYILLWFLFGILDDTLKVLFFFVIIV